MLVNTKVLFLSLIKSCRCSLVMDIGSRDGVQSLAFRDVLPHAKVIAVEANPYNFADMKANAILAASNITLQPFAMTDKDGKTLFHVSDADYASPESDNNNRGTSSVLIRRGLPTKASVEVETVRVDTFLNRSYSGEDNIGLWIDVEGAEYLVLDGIKAVRDKIKVVHVETARVLMREGQRCLDEVKRLMADYGFLMLGSNLRPSSIWGDVVFVRDSEYPKNRWSIVLALCKARLSYLFRVDEIAGHLKQQYPALHRRLRRLFVKGI
jgi:FkbM family methyltransferase